MTSGSARLSRREQEVAVLVAEGMTDRQIAQQLFISERTAEGHVQGIRNKLGFDNRAQIASWVAMQGLVPGASPARPGAAPVPNNLPVQLTTFIGRERELGETRRLLQRTRLLTITGPGGCGKTRLAVEAAGEVIHRYPDGAWFVDLGAVGDPDVVPRAVAEALGIAEREGVDPLQAVAAELAGARGRRQCLVILDNCEHLVERCAETVAALLGSSRQLTFVCTSREPLHVAGEVTWALGPLSMPEPGVQVSLDELRRFEAVRLFLDRAALSDPGFELTAANAAAIRQLCERLDGIPLALELAAAHVGVLSLDELLRGLERRFGVLRSRTAPARQRTLSATISWSYDLLDEAERRLLRRLSLFRGGFSLDAADRVCDDGEEAGVFDRLARLADKSLVLPVLPRRERYRCLDIIRRYAWDRLAESGEQAEVRGRHLAFYLALAERAAGELRGPGQPEWLARLGTEHDNLRAALEASREAALEERLRLVVALEPFWAIRGHLGEGRQWVADALGAAGALGSTALHARALDAAARLALHQDQAASARTWLEASLAIWRELGDRPGVQACLTNLGLAASRLGDWTAARAHFSESLSLARELGNRRAIAILLNNLGLMAAYLDDHDTALVQLEECLRIMRSLGDPMRVADSLANLGMLALYRGDVEAASGHFAESLHIVERLDAPQYLVECLEGFACIAARRGHAERALRLAGTAAAIRESIGTPQPPWSRKLEEGWMLDARRTVGPSAARAREEGRKLAPEQAIALALESVGPSPA
jgi:predicted ATPase/DNA-binding CsgD family transcriptional regulator